MVCVRKWGKITLEHKAEKKYCDPMDVGGRGVLLWSDYDRKKYLIEHVNVNV